VIAVKDVYLESWNIPKPPGSPASPNFSFTPGQKDGQDAEGARKFDEIKGISQELYEATKDLGQEVVSKGKEMHKEANTDANRDGARNLIQEWLKLNLTTARDCLREFIVGYKIAKAQDFNADDVTVEAVYNKTVAKYEEVKQKVRDSVDVVKEEKDEFVKERDAERKAEGWVEPDKDSVRGKINELGTMASDKLTEVSKKVEDTVQVIREETTVVEELEKVQKKVKEVGEVLEEERDEFFKEAREERERKKKEREKEELLELLEGDKDREEKHKR
jgi:hypothetical protein